MAVHPEALLLSSIVKTGDYQVLMSGGVTPQLFHAFEDEADWMFRYITTHRRAPSRIDMRQQFPDFTFYKGADNVAHYADEVMQSHKSYALMDATNSAMDLIDAEDPDAAIALIHETALKIAQETAGISRNMDALSDWQGVYDDVVQRQATARSNGGVAGVPTGFDFLDGVTGGLQPGWLCIAAARLGQGKTWFGVKTAFTASMRGKKVIYFSLEQPRNQIAMRIHAFGSRKYAKNPFNPMDLARGMNVDLMQYKKFLQDMAAQKGNGQLLINDSSRGRLTAQGIGSIIETDQPDLVIIDYLTLMASTGDDWRSAARLPGEIKELATTYNLPILALAQINRNGAGGKEPPGTEDLYSSDAIGHDADLVLTQMQKSTSVMMHKIAKFRHGPAGGKWYSEFNPAGGVFEEISGADAEQLIQDDMEDD